MIENPQAAMQQPTEGGEQSTQEEGDYPEQGA